MKKSLIALAVMAAAGAASAQSSVTLFGIVDTALQWTKGGPGDVRFAVVSNGYNSSRLGFRGTEDLGGGMAASFWLEGALFPDSGTSGGLSFTRRSTVSLSGGWGELRLGRDYTPTFWNITVFDPFGTNGSGTTATFQPGATGPAGIRASNSIGYFFPANIGGVYGQVMYGENELPNNTGPGIDNGRYFGGRVGFASGPFNVAFAAGRTDVTGPGLDNIMTMNLGGSWDFGMAKLMGQLVMDRNAGGVDTNDGKGFLIGGLVPVGAGEIRLAYSQYRFDTPLGNPKVKKLAVGYVHNLSKRTAVYATLAHLKNSGGAAQGVNSNAFAAGTALNDSSSAVDVGVRHSF